MYHLISIIRVLLYTIILLILVFLSIRLPFIGLALLVGGNLLSAYIAFLFNFKMFVLHVLFYIFLSFMFLGRGFTLLTFAMILVPNLIGKVLNHTLLSVFRRLTVILCLSMGFGLGIWSLMPLFNTDGYKLWNIEEQIKQQTSKTINYITKVYNEQKKGFDSTNNEINNIDMFIQNFTESIEYILALIPTTYFFIWYFFTTLITYIFFYNYSKNLGKRFDIPSFAFWKFNGNLVWLFILGWFLHYIDDIFEFSIGNFSSFQAIGANLLAISKILYFVAGASIIYYWFEKYNVGTFNRIGLSILAIILNNIVIWLGIIDVWADFRALNANAFRYRDFSSDDENL